LLNKVGLLGILSFLPFQLSGQEVFTSHHVAKLRRVTEVAVSPDGSSVAYVLEVPRVLFTEEDGPAYTELHLVGKAKVSVPYVFGQVNVSHISWRPGGKEISFLARRKQAEPTALFVIPVDGGEARKLLTHDTSIEEYSWNPDGKQVAFLAQKPLPSMSHKLNEMGFNQKIYEEDWRPIRVWIAEWNGGVSSVRELKLPGSASELHWSPAGNRLAVALAPTSLLDDWYLNRKVHVVDVLSGKGVMRLQNPGKLGQIAWSPDGQQLALITAADRHDPMEGRLVVSSVSDGKMRDLLPGYNGHVKAIAWRDKDTIVFLADKNVWTTLGSIQADGSGLETILPARGPIVSGLSVSSDGHTAALVAHTSRHPTELFLLERGEAKPSRLTDSNPWLNKLRLAPQEVVSFTARDGLHLEGILIRPLDEKQGRKYPLVITVHGGPEAHYQDGWVTSYEDPGQVAASKGLAVFYPNYRGSTGRGVEFSKLDHKDFAGKEFDDLVDAIDYLATVGLIDPQKVGITGASYGGYASAWAATYYSHRFAASVMLYGVGDRLSIVGTSGNAKELYQVHDRLYPWEDWQLFLARSPIYHAQKGLTPLLIAQGTGDPTVPPGQSLEMYRYLKWAGHAPVRLVLYPGEPHGFERATARLDYNLRLIRWMEHYLKGSGGQPPPYEMDYGELPED
jgi:dipeptidyl aminopeptidase/acylaminoacyl peptidase